LFNPFKKPKWYYLKLKKDYLFGVRKTNQTDPVRFTQQGVEIEEAIVCSDPTKNWTWDYYKDKPITHPLEMAEFYKEHFRRVEHEHSLEQEVSVTCSFYEIMFWAEIPEKIALKFSGVMG
jgi:hypothetical protein